MVTRTALLEDPELRPFLPLLFVAWSDGDLEETDLAILEAHIERMPWLRPAARIALSKWLDPKDPPSWLELRTLHEAMERVSGTLAAKRRRELLALGTAMVGADASDATKKALAALEAELGGEESPKIEDTAPHEEAGVVFDVAELRRVLDGPHEETRDRVRAFVSDPERRAYGLPVPEYRAKVAGWMKALAAEGFGALAYPGVTSDAKDLGAFFAVFETLAMGDLSLLVKCGVQFGLFGGSIFFLGRLEHRIEGRAGDRDPVRVDTPSIQRERGKGRAASPRLPPSSEAPLAAPRSSPEVFSPASRSGSRARASARSRAMSCAARGSRRRRRTRSPYVG